MMRILVFYFLFCWTFQYAKAETDLLSQPKQAIETAPENAPTPAELFAPTIVQSSSLPPQGQPECTEALSLEQAISVVLKNSTAVLKAENDITFTGIQLIQGYFRFLPNLQVQGTYSYINGTSYLTFATPTTVIGQSASLGYTVISSLNLFNGFADAANLKASLLKKNAADLSLVRAKQMVVLDTTQAFLQVILDHEIVKIANKNLSLSQERQKLLEEQTRVGIRNLSDLFRQQAQTSSDELFLMSSLNKERSDEILLFRKLRLDVTRNYHLLEPKIEEGKADPKYQNESELIKKALENRLDLQASTSLVDAGAWDVVTSRGSYYPQLDLRVAVNSGGSLLQQQVVNGVNTVPGLQEPLLNQLGPQTNYTAGVTLTFSLFDRWNTRLAVAQTQRTSDNLEIDLLDRKLQVEGEIRGAYGDYQTALQQLESSKKGLESAQKAYEVTQGRYEVGAASFVDLTTAQTALVQAGSNRAQALIGFLLQEKTMDFALGTTPVN